LGLILVVALLPYLIGLWLAVITLVLLALQSVLPRGRSVVVPKPSCQLRLTLTIKWSKPARDLAPRNPRNCNQDCLPQLWFSSEEVGAFLRLKD
jgi:hypothetical protein